MWPETTTDWVELVTWKRKARLEKAHVGEQKAIVSEKASRHLSIRKVYRV